ncbi:MAG: hypothetical protein RBU30_12880, partial [Polyangia bacterium]|nr:hypothetical protein [Polyangia bacterium]
MRSAIALCLFVILTHVGCAEPSRKEQRRAELAWPPPVPPASCPVFDWATPTWFEHYVPTSVSSDPICRGWLAEKEKYLCWAYYYFNAATTFSAAGGTPEERLSFFRAAVETLTTMLFDLEDYYGPQYTWNPAYTEDKVVIKCGGGGSGGL